MKCACYALTLLFLFATLPLMSGHGAEPKKPSIMQRKLQHAQKVLEGLALKDFKTIRKSADELLFLSKEEEWKVLGTPEYDRYSNEFRRNTQSLIKSAKEENIDACALSYVQLTLTCVNCHKHVREVRMGRLPGGVRGRDRAVSTRTSD